ncbi:MAG: sigma 54-interacting transcriptional regulator [Pseudomonadota bacterium]|nr:sigma 54-interacting transcriptional regulator [Pseudomonadota bacterium]
MANDAGNDFDQSWSSDGSAQPVLALVLSTPEHAVFFAEEAFLRAGCQVIHAQSLPEAQILCEERRPDVVVLPLRLSGESLIPYLGHCKASHDPGIVVVAQNEEINDAAEAMRAGADDCLFHPFSSARLTRTLRAILGAPDGTPPFRFDVDQTPAPMPLRAPAPRAREPEPETQSATSHGMIGQSPDMRRLFRKVDVAAKACDPVLIHGEVGTGKTRFAQAIHAGSDRADAPCITVNCATLDGGQFLENVFGRDEPGLLEQAKGGTLIVDRLDELDRGIQGRLLPLVSRDPKERPHDVRMIVTLTRSPTQALAENRLREDLLYVLNVITFPLPPLRLRDGDMGRIMTAKITEISDALNRTAPSVDAEAMAVLSSYPWPGNLSELVSTLRGVLLTADDVIGRRDLPQELVWHHVGNQKNPTKRSGDTPAVNGLGSLVGKRLADVERAVIEATIAAEGGSVPRAAKVLDVSPSTIYRKREGWTNPS